MPLTTKRLYQDITPSSAAGTQIPGNFVRPRAVPELLLVICLYTIYKIGRVLANGHVERAFANAHRVWSLERVLHLPSEVLVQHALLSSEFLVRCGNVYYATVHFPATIAFLLWIYIWRPTHYLWIRRLMAASTGLALAVHLVFPLAPPRMLNGIGLIDTAARYGPSVYGPPSTDTLSNQYAAMPSLHVGWALLIAIGLIVTTHGRFRWLWLLYPATTFFVVLGTANHYWLDGFAGAIIVLGLLPLIRRVTPVADVTVPAVSESLRLAFRRTSFLDRASRAAPFIQSGLIWRGRPGHPITSESIATATTPDHVAPRGDAVDPKKPPVRRQIPRQSGSFDRAAKVDHAIGDPKDS